MSEPNHPLTRTMRGLAAAYQGWRYTLLFYLLLVTLVAGPLLNTLGFGTQILEVLLALNLIAAVVPVGAGIGRRLLWIAVLCAFAFRLGVVPLEQEVLTAAIRILWTVTGLVAAASGLRFAFSAKRVDREHVYAALDAYLLAGMFMGLLYWALERVSPGSIVMNGQPIHPELTLPSAIYFSFVTLATLGYGDLVPHSEIARGLAIVEAVAGQLYLAVMIARLVSLYVRAEDSSPT